MSNFTTVPATTLALNATSPQSRPGETQFALVALVVTLSFIVLCGVPIVFFRFFVTKQSVESRSRRNIKKRAKGEHLANNIWGALDRARDQEMAEAAKLRTEEQLGIGAIAGADGVGGGDGGGDSDDSDVGYADFSHAPIDNAPPLSLVYEDARPLYQQCLQDFESQRRHKAAAAVPASTRIQTALGHIRVATEVSRGSRTRAPLYDATDDDEFRDAGVPSEHLSRFAGGSQMGAGRPAAQFVPPSQLPWLQARRENDRRRAAGENLLPQDTTSWQCHADHILGGYVLMESPRARTVREENSPAVYRGRARLLADDLL